MRTHFILADFVKEGDLKKLAREVIESEDRGC